jgi:hypothetical protein
MEIRAVGAQFFHACRRTNRRINGQTDRHADMTKLMAPFAILRTRLTKKNRLKIAHNS